MDAWFIIKINYVLDCSQIKRLEESILLVKSATIRGARIKTNPKKRFESKNVNRSQNRSFEKRIHKSCDKSLNIKSWFAKERFE